MGSQSQLCPRSFATADATGAGAESRHRGPQRHEATECQGPGPCAGRVRSGDRGPRVGLRLAAPRPQPPSLLHLPRAHGLGAYEPLAQAQHRRDHDAQDDHAHDDGEACQGGQREEFVEERLQPEEDEDETDAVLQTEEAVEQVAGNKEKLRQCERGHHRGAETDVAAGKGFDLRDGDVDLEEKVGEQNAEEQQAGRGDARLASLRDEQGARIIHGHHDAFAEQPPDQSDRARLHDVKVLVLLLHHRLPAHVNEPQAEEVRQDLQRPQPHRKAHVEDKLEGNLAEHDDEQHLLRDPPRHPEVLDYDVEDKQVLDGEDELQEVANEPQRGRFLAQADVDQRVVEGGHRHPDQQGGAVEELRAGPVQELMVESDKDDQGGRKDAPVEELHGPPKPRSGLCWQFVLVPAGPEHVVPNVLELLPDRVVEFPIAGQPVLDRLLLDDLFIDGFLDPLPDGLLDGLVVELVADGAVWRVGPDRLLELFLLRCLPPLLLAGPRLFADFLR
mmetsp:Transcript_117697/g.327752  ORF Transcript_117697/g.327752 Transcript_117697/m.327752 type:complete len:502 (+) Transcript_117697:144-1649(+)